MHTSSRLWVHEALRNFYDRLSDPSEKSEIFECIKACVRTVFRENFDSAFEHLGKVDGQVTQQNLRNLLFGSYVASGSREKESESSASTEESRSSAAPATSAERKDEDDTGHPEENQADEKASASASSSSSRAVAVTTTVGEVQNIDVLVSQVQKVAEDAKRGEGEGGGGGGGHSSRATVLPVR